MKKYDRSKGSKMEQGIKTPKSLKRNKFRKFMKGIFSFKKLRALSILSKDRKKV